MYPQRSATQKTEVNRPSRLLSDQENNEVYSIIGKRSVTLSTTVAQVFQCLPRHNQWQKISAGVVCFVKDNLRKSYFIRLVNFSNRSVVWEQELYSQFMYQSKAPQFHSFEADDCVAGVNFADGDEALHFRKVISEKLAIKQAKIKEIKERRQTIVKRDAARNAANTNNSSHVLQPIQTNTVNPPATVSPAPSLTDVSAKNKKNKQQKGGKKPKLTKGDIGTPSDFRHVGHVGWDPKGGFDVDNIDPQWKKLFDTIGVTENQLQDEETSQFIYDFVEQHGGIEKATKELEKNSAPAPPPPARSVLPPPPTSRAPPPRGPAPPPPPGQRTPQPARAAPPPPQPGRSAPPPPPSRYGSAPPPPPPSTSAPRAPPPFRQAPTRAGPPPPPVGAPTPPPPPTGAPAPPPPPPPPPPPTTGGGPPPPPPPMSAVNTPSPAPAAPAGRGGLLDQIHHGMQLKKVDTSQTSSGGGSGRNNLLEEIRTGANLKSVSDEPRQSADPGELDGLAGALMKALAKRKEHIQSDGEEEDDEDVWEDEWEDED